MIPKCLIFAWIVALALIGCGGPTAEWQTFRSEQGNFTVNAPAPLQERVQTEETALGTIQEGSFVLEEGAVRYSVKYTDYPVPAAARANPLGALDGALRRVLAAHDAELVKQRDIALGEALGIAFQAARREGIERTTPDVLYGEVLLLDARVYQVTVVMPKGQVHEANPQRFLDSFRWIESQAATPFMQNSEGYK